MSISIVAEDQATLPRSRSRHREIHVEASVGYCGLFIGVLDGVDEGEILRWSRTENNLHITVESTPADVSPGESGELVAELDCEYTFENDTLSVGLEIDGGTVSAEIAGDEGDRPVSVTCEGQS